MIAFMKHLVNIILFSFITFFMGSCVTNNRLIGNSWTDYGRIKFYAVKALGDKNTIEKIYADIDSNNIKKYYSFYPDRIVMTDERRKQLSYTVVFQQLPNKYDNNIYRPLSLLDSLVFSKAMTLLSRTEYSNLKKPKEASGFVIVVNYYHGFPKNQKFKPL